MIGSTIYLQGWWCNHGAQLFYFTYTQCIHQLYAQCVPNIYYLIYKPVFACFLCEPEFVQYPLLCFIIYFQYKYCIQINLINPLKLFTGASG